MFDFVQLVIGSQFHLLDEAFEKGIESFLNIFILVFYEMEQRIVRVFTDLFRGLLGAHQYPKYFSKLCNRLLILMFGLKIFLSTLLINKFENTSKKLSRR